MNAKVLIVDDEPGSRNVLRKYAGDIPGITLVGECRDAFEANDTLAKEQVDILLLDINMPRLSGISFARSLTRAPLIIFTTAYPEYAVEGFELNALDYLVKPFSFERFLKAINKGLDRLSKQSDRQLQEASIIVRSDKKIYALKSSEIIYLEGCGDYIKLVLKDENTLLVHETIKSFLARLNNNEILRTHKSYAVNISHIQYIEGNQVFTEAAPVPVSETYKEEVLKIYTQNPPPLVREAG